MDSIVPGPIEVVSTYLYTVPGVRPLSINVAGSLPASTAVFVRCNLFVVPQQRQTMLFVVGARAEHECGLHQRTTVAPHGHRSEPSRITPANCRSISRIGYQQSKRVAHRQSRLFECFGTAPELLWPAQIDFLTKF
jgi:hypothetical protein